MSSIIYKLKEIIKAVLIQEIGDGSSKPYFYKKNNDFSYRFLAKIGKNQEEVKVEFENFNHFPSSHKNKILPQQFQDSNLTFNVGYSVGGTEFQFEKSDLKTLLRIVSTVVLIVKEFIKSQSPDILYIIGSPKKPGEKNMAKKDNLYKAFLWKQLDLIPGYLAENRREGFIVYKDLGN